MRIALVADLHGNWPAVQAMERDIARRGADEIYCLGDLVGKGPSSDKTCDWAFANCSVILGGNWDLLGCKSWPPCPWSIILTSAACMSGFCTAGR